MASAVLNKHLSAYNWRFHSHALVVPSESKANIENRKGTTFSSAMKEW